jgi:membrane-associated phospholipid phosphatase
MSRKILLMLVVFSFFHVPGFAQKTDTLTKKLDSLAKEPDRARKNEELNVNKTDYTARTNFTPKSYFVLLGSDIMQEVTGPFHAQKGSWIKVGEFALLEGALVFSDKAIQKNSQIFMEQNQGMKNVSQYVTDFGAMYEVYTLAAFGLYGVIFKSNKVKTTTLLATQSYIAAGAMSWVAKFATGRRRPNSFTPGNENNLVFMGPGISGSRNSFGSSFPSGHTTAAFSAATVFADEYHEEILIPVIAYSAATLVGLSRITQNAHWASDIFAGAALGYVTGKQVVFNYHRYARLQQQGTKKKVTMFFNLQYNDGIIMPGMVCKF